MLDNSTVPVLVYQPLSVDPWGTAVVTGLQLDFVSLTSILWIWPLSCTSTARLEGFYRIQQQKPHWGQSGCSPLNYRGSYFIKEGYSSDGAWLPFCESMLKSLWNVFVNPCCCRAAGLPSCCIQCSCVCGRHFSGTITKQKITERPNASVGRKDKCKASWIADDNTQSLVW